jgi:hypothetical protein
MWRLSSTFSEASAMANYMAVGVSLQGWRVATTTLRWKEVFYFVSMVICLLLTVSSVGYACLIAIVVVGGAMHIAQVVRNRQMVPTKVILGLLLTTGSITLFTLSGGAKQSVSKAIVTTLLDKKETQSYRDRAMTNAAALDTLSDTYDMGAGWGSVRASGLIYTLLGNIGVPGGILFVAVYLSLFVPLCGRSTRANVMSHGYDLYEQSLFAITVLMLGLVLAGVAPIDPILWALFGIATAAKVSSGNQVPQSGPRGYFDGERQSANRYIAPA